MSFELWVKIQGLGFKRLGFRVLGLGFTVQGLGFRVQGFGNLFRIGLGFRVRFKVRGLGLSV